jgi:hypothetical protein
MGGVNRERAERHLRQIAETELRRAVVAPAHHFSLAELMAPRRDSAVRFSQIANALIAVGAIEEDTAAAIQFDYELAVTARVSGAPSGRVRLLSPPVLRRQAARLLHGPSPKRQPAPDRVTAVGMMIPVRYEDVRGELYVMAYAHTPTGARFTVAAWLRGPVFGRPPQPTSTADAMHKLTATDDRGTAYQLGYRGPGGLVEWAGELFLRPDPPPDIGWLEIAAGETIRRIQLDQQAAPPGVTLVTGAHSPGEHYLHGVAARVLASLPPFTKDDRRHAAGFRPVLPEHLIRGLGDVVDALQVAGDLSPLSPVPGQLRTLCESIGISDHGLTATPRTDLPEPWLSLLTSYHRRRPDTASPGEGCAGVAVTLPELDGVRLSILGVHNGVDGTIIHVHAAGLPANGKRDDIAFPLLWIRDEDGRWHTTRRGTAGINTNGELSSRLEVIPPLNRSSWIEILAAGPSAEVRAGLPLRWR